MHLSSLSSFALLCIVVSGTLVTPSHKGVCNPSSRQDNLQKLQQEAIKDYAHIILEKKDAQAAFDKYVPGKYIQHNPSFSENGRDATLTVLVPFFKTPGLSTSHLRAIAGEGLGILHYKLTVDDGENPPRNTAISDIFRFQGTCLVEHWDVLQAIFGNETNPIAFF